jgi:ABC-type Fe3+ transport system permease subunit
MDENADADILKTIITIPVTLVFLYVTVMAFGPVIDFVINDMWGTLDSSNTFYSDSLITTISTAFTTWHAYVVITAAMGFAYLAILVYKRQRYSEVDQYDDYFR